MSGSFVVSLDFELHWGVRDHTPVQAYRTELLGARAVIPRLLALFQAYEIRATWAVVGMLLAEDKDELLETTPSLRPQYGDDRLDPYRSLHEIGRNEEDDPFHFAPSLARTIAATPGQEIGTHTFSHFYALEEGVTMDAFVADLAAARAITLRRGLPAPSSIVFPRNQYSADHVRMLPGCGISAYRSAAPGFFHRPRPTVRDGWVRRVARTIDAHVPIVRDPGRPRGGPALALPASRFLRPWSRRTAPLHARRIETSMSEAAQTGADFHLWWHPHNFGSNPTYSVDFLCHLLDHFRTLHDRYGMQSRHMADRAAALGT